MTDLTKITSDMLDAGALAPSPTTTKGDLRGHNGSAEVRVPTGVNGQFLSADSSQTTGLLWATPAGVPVGAVMRAAWAAAESGWYECNAQALNRTTHAALFAKMTFTRNGTLSSSSAVVTGLSTTADLYEGEPLEGTGIAAGTRILSIDSASQITMTATASATGVQSLRFLPFGAGDGSTTFNTPDLRGAVGSGAGQFSRSHKILSVSTGANTLSIEPSHAFETGAAVVYATSATAIQYDVDGTPTNLTNGGTYYAIRVGVSSIRIALTRADAVANLALDLTGVGSGVQTLTFSGTDRKAGQRYGEEAHALTIAELASHDHSGGVDNTGSVSSGGGTKSLNARTGFTGGSAAHQNEGPRLCIREWIYSGV